MSFPLMPFGGGVELLRSTSVFAQVVSNTATIVVPSSVKAGDLLILADAPDFSSNNPTIVVPTGLTLVASQGYGVSYSSGAVVSAKIASASDAGSILTGMNGDQGNAKSLLVVRGDIDIKSFSAAINKAGTNSDAAPTSQTASGTGVVSPAIVIGVAGGTNPPFGGGVPFTVQNPSFTTTSATSFSNNDLTQGFSSVTAGASAFSQTIDMGDNGSNTLLVFWFEVR
jgi:hypothetical protein